MTTGQIYGDALQLLTTAAASRPAPKKSVWEAASNAFTLYVGGQKQADSFTLEASSVEKVLEGPAAVDAGDSSLPSTSASSDESMMYDRSSDARTAPKVSV
ncbi:unnamed protein product [Polarella glacialis]|uniref:Uncharacterized protein n=1 Tax=Polarella glacialis TaxID=89957 RepID=A0A813DGS2_POLGL|nr:unnamed protein product [Polarella glacialis]